MSWYKEDAVYAVIWGVGQSISINYHFMEIG